MNMQFDLPAPSNDAAPAFSSVEACTTWVGALPMSNVATAQAHLRAQIAVLPIAGFKPSLLLDIAECLRGAVVQVQTEMARKYSFRPVPLAEMEGHVLETSQDLWRGFCLIYQVCVQSVLDGERDLKGQTGLVCQRALDVQGRLIFDTMCAGSEVPAADWLLLHKLYVAAETIGVAVDKVKDRLLRGVGATHCMGTYARPLLLSLGLPSDVGYRMMAPLISWIDRLANRVVITSLFPQKPVKPPLLVDTTLGQGAFRPEFADESYGGKGLRYLDIGNLEMALKKRVHLLRKGESPASLGLSEDIPVPVLERTLISLYRHWGDGRVGRELPRRAATTKALVATGMAAIHFFVSGKPFRQPGPAPEMSTRQMREIATFGRGSAQSDGEAGSTAAFAMEEWTLVDENVAGMRMMRPSGAGGARVVPGTLVGIRPSDASAFMIGVVRWARMQADGILSVGVQALPGAPAAVAVRIPATGIGVADDKYRQGLMLPAVPVLQYPASILVPTGWFAPGRVIDVHAEPARLVALDAVAEHLDEYDRCTYAAT
jgi:hypothetical protein